jgi:hypothetical protein
MTTMESRAKEIRKNTYFLCAAIVLVFLLALAAVFLLRKELGITGFGIFNTETYSQDLGLIITSDQDHDWKLQQHPEHFSLRSVMLSGSLRGEGDVQAYLVAPDGKEYLILDNNAIESVSDQITGLAIDAQTSSEDDSVAATQGPEKEIALVLDYQTGTIWDADNDGTAFTEDDAVDFTVKDTLFSWDVDTAKLCTRWTITADTGSSTSLCNGAADCCGLVSLAPNDDAWDAPLYLYHSQYGSTTDNAVSAQVIFLDQDLDHGKVHFDSAQSSIKTLPARFIDSPEQGFTAVCTDTCHLPDGFDADEYTIRFRVGPGTMLKIGSVMYMVEVQDPPENQDLPKSNNFKGSTTSFASLPDLGDVDDLTIEKQGKGRIKWKKEGVNVAGADFDRHVRFGKGWVSVDTENLDNDINSSAEITLYGLPYEYAPAIYADGELCTGCEILSYENGALTFIVPHFTNFTTVSNTELRIWDQNDTAEPYADQHAGVDQQVYFYANYSNTTGAPLVGAACNISFFDMQNLNMAYNSTTKLYNHNRTFSSSALRYWNVTCSKALYETINLTDSIVISPASGQESNLSVNKTSTEFSYYDDETVEFIINITNLHNSGMQDIMVYDDFNSTELTFNGSSCDLADFTDYNFTEGWFDLNVTDCRGGSGLPSGQSELVYVNFTAAPGNYFTTNEVDVNGTGARKPQYMGRHRLRGKSTL